jgi:hypothetical protein
MPISYLQRTRTMRPRSWSDVNWFIHNQFSFLIQHLTRVQQMEREHKPHSVFKNSWNMLINYCNKISYKKTRRSQECVSFGTMVSRIGPIWTYVCMYIWTKVCTHYLHTNFYLPNTYNMCIKIVTPPPQYKWKCFLGKFIAHTYICNL